MRTHHCGILLVAVTDFRCEPPARSSHHLLRRSTPRRRSLWRRRRSALEPRPSSQPRDVRSPAYSPKLLHLTHEVKRYRPSSLAGKRRREAMTVKQEAASVGESLHVGVGLEELVHIASMISRSAGSSLIPVRFRWTRTRPAA